MGYVVLLIGIGLITFTIYRLVQTAKFAKVGQRVTGTVIKIRVERRPRRIYYYPTIQFTTLKNSTRRFESKSSIPWPFFWFKEGDIVPILYDPDDPSRAEISFGYSLWGPWLVLGLMSLFLIGMALIELRFLPFGLNEILMGRLP